MKLLSIAIDNPSSHEQLSADVIFRPIVSFMYLLLPSFKISELTLDSRFERIYHYTQLSYFVRLPAPSGLRVSSATLENATPINVIEITGKYCIDMKAGIPPRLTHELQFCMKRKSFTGSHFSTFFLRILKLMKRAKRPELSAENRGRKYSTGSA